MSTYTLPLILVVLVLTFTFVPWILRVEFQILGFEFAASRNSEVVLPGSIVLRVRLVVQSFWIFAQRVMAAPVLKAIPRKGPDRTP